MDTKNNFDRQIDQLLDRQVSARECFTDNTIARIQTDSDQNFKTLDESLDRFLGKNNLITDPAFTEKTIQRIRNEQKIIRFPLPLFARITVAAAACLTFGLFWRQTTFPGNEPPSITAHSQIDPQETSLQNEQLIALAESLGNEASWLLNEDAPATLIVALAN